MKLLHRSELVERCMDRRNGTRRSAGAGRLETRQRWQLPL